MAITPLRMLLLFGGTSAAAVATAYTLGAFNPPPAPPQAAVSIPQNKPTDNQEAQAKPAEQQTAALQPKPEPPAAVKPVEPILPVFDVVRAEPDGSVVIAGKAAPNAKVEIVAGDQVIANATATPEGDFAAVLDEPLKPGDHILSLRASGTAGTAVMSAQTALISIPQTPDGQLLAMVEEAGAPSRIMTKPAPTEPAAPQAEPTVAAATSQAQEPAAPTAARLPQTGKVAVEAVEIENAKLFVAGAAPAGVTVRIYANDQLLGETRATPEGRFLLELKQDLPVGEYKVRADAVARDGKEVLARAEVDFTREPGEAIAAVAPLPPSTPAQAEPVAAVTSQPVQTPPVAAPQVPEPATVSAKLKAASGGVIIRRGDSLWRISKRVYGQGTRFSTIYLANDVQIRDPNKIYPGQVFRVPEKTDKGEAADMSGLGEQATTVEDGPVAAAPQTTQ